MFKEQFTQTILTLEDIESLLHGLVPQKILLVDFSPCGVSQDVADFPSKEPCSVFQGAQGSYVKSSCFENTENMPVSNLQSAYDMKLFWQSKNINSAMKELEKSTKLTHKRAKLCAKSTNDTINRLQQSKSDICVTKISVSKKHSHSDGKRKRCKTKSKVLFRDLKTVELDDDKCSNESNKKQDQNVSNFMCSYCFKQCASKKSLQMHVRNHEKDKKYSCEICGKTFLHANGLCLHSRIHTGERPFKCVSCGKAFISSSALKRHQLVHMGGKDAVVLSDVKAANVCPSCGKAFSQKGNLTVHMKIHFGKYDHVCKICQKQFITSGDLKRHKRVHSREKPYTCDNCQKSFTTSSTLVCHMRSHSGERPYLCGVCGATFAILSHLKQHNKIHARGDLWPRRKGAATTGENTRKKTLHVAKQIAVSLDKDKKTASTVNNGSKQKRDSNTIDKDMSVVASSYQLPDIPSVDFVDSSIQPRSNSLFINSVVPRTVHNIQSPRGITYVGEKEQVMKLISDSGNNVQRLKTSISHTAISDTEECETNRGMQGVISQRDATAVTVQCLPSADSTIATRTFIKLSDVISSNNNRPFQCNNGESTVSLCNPTESTAIANGNIISLCDRLNSYISPVMPMVQHVNLSSNMEHIQTKDTLTVTAQGIQCFTSNLYEDKGLSNCPPIIPSIIHNNINCALLPARSICSNAHTLISTKKLDSTTSLAFQTIKHEVNSLSFSTSVSVDRITSDAATSVLANKVDSMGSIPASITSSRFNSVNSSFPAHFISSNIHIGHTATPTSSDRQSATYIGNTATSPFSISFPRSDRNILTIMPAEAVTEKRASLLGSDQHGGDYHKR